MPDDNAKIIHELDRRIANVEKEAAWRKQNAEEYLAGFKRYVAECLALSDMESQAAIVSKSSDTANEYRRYCLVCSELQQLKALKEDIQKGRIDLDQ